MFYRHCLPLVAATLLTAQSGTAQNVQDGISPTEQLIADLLISIAQIELDLKNRGAEGLEPPNGNGDLLKSASDRVATLDEIELPAPQPDPADVSDVVPKEQPPEQPPVIEPAIRSGDADGIGVVPVSLDGRTVHSALFQDLSDSEKAKLPEADPARCGELGDWFQTLELEREHTAFFVIEDPHVRICRLLPNGWFIKLAKFNNRAHLIEATE